MARSTVVLTVRVRLMQAKFQKQRLEKEAARLSKGIDVFRPKSADYGSGLSALGAGVRRACDVPFGSRSNANHKEHNLKFGELWDPYATLESVAPTMKQVQPAMSRRPNDAGVPLQLGIGLGQLWRPDQLHLTLTLTLTLTLISTLSS